MTDVSKIQVSTTTGIGPPRPDNPETPTGGSDGEVFLFIGGREFRLNIQQLPGESGTHNDHVPGQMDVVILGDGTNAVDKQFHDPRKPYGQGSKPFVIENLDKYPVWLRFEPRDASDNWFLEYALVEVFAANSAQPRKKYEILKDPDAKINLWLGKKFGLHVSLLPPPPTTTTTTVPTTVTT
jgi:hypothetical protein